MRGRSRRWPRSRPRSCAERHVGAHDLREVERERLLRPVAAAARRVAADHRVVQDVGEVDVEVALVGLAEVDGDVLALALERLIEELDGRDVGRLGDDDLADGGGGGLTVGRAAGRAGDASADAPLEAVDLDPLLVAGRGDVAFNRCILHINRHRKTPRDGCIQGHLTLKDLAAPSTLKGTKRQAPPHAPTDHRKDSRRVEDTGTADPPTGDSGLAGSEMILSRLASAQRSLVSEDGEEGSTFTPLDLGNHLGSVASSLTCPDLDRSSRSHTVTRRSGETAVGNRKN